MQKPPRRNILIVEDSFSVLSFIVEDLIEVGFTGPKPFVPFNKTKPETFILRRGDDQIHITSFKGEAIEAMEKHSYTAAFFDFMVFGEKGDHAYMQDAIVDMLQRQPLCPVYIISGDAPEKQTKFMIEAAERSGSGVNILGLIGAKLLYPFSKESSRICDVIEATLGVPQIQAEAGEQPAAK